MTEGAHVSTVNVVATATASHPPVEAMTVEQRRHLGIEGNKP